MYDVKYLLNILLLKVSKRCFFRIFYPCLTPVFWTFLKMSKIEKSFGDLPELMNLLYTLHKKLNILKKEKKPEHIFFMIFDVSLKNDLEIKYSN